MKLLIKNGILNDPTQGIENEKCSILVDKGIVKKIGKSISEPKAKVIDAKGKYVFPGLIDMHVHLREPGSENKETIKSGSTEAANGGFTSIACMANTTPVIDTAGQIRFIKVTADAEAIVKVYPYGAVTRELKGELITEMGDMLEAGAVAFSDDGVNIANSGTMMRAMEYLKRFDKPIVVHAEDMAVVGRGTINAGFFAETKGLHGIPKESEEIIIGRDIQLSRLTGGRVHFTHISTKGAVELIKDAKKEGLAVTCDVTPHHLSLTCEDIGNYNTNMKMKPPLRDDEDVKALKKAVLSGLIDAIGTDHAPHTEFEKSLEFNLAPNGIIGLGTAIPIILESIVEYKEKRMPIFANILSANPAKILGIEGGTLKEGSTADITIIDADTTYTYTKDMIKSKSTNSPYLGKKLRGYATHTIVAGEIVSERVI